MTDNFNISDTPPATGKLIQEITAKTGALISTSVLIPLDDTIPQQTEGSEILTVEITPTNIDSTLIIEAQMFGTPVTNQFVIGAIFRDAESDSIAASTSFAQATTSTVILAFKAIVTASSKVAQTFKLRVGTPFPGSVEVNGTSIARLFGGVGATSLTVKEILPAS